MILKRYCICGVVLSVDVLRHKRDRILANWYAAHDGAGHGETDAAGAEAARMGTGTGMGRETRKEYSK